MFWAMTSTNITEKMRNNVMDPIRDTINRLYAPSCVLHVLIIANLIRLYQPKKKRAKGFLHFAKMPVIEHSMHDFRGYLTDNQSDMKTILFRLIREIKTPADLDDYLEDYVLVLKELNIDQYNIADFFNAEDAVDPIIKVVAAYTKSELKLKGINILYYYLTIVYIFPPLLLETKIPRQLMSKSDRDSILNRSEQKIWGTLSCQYLSYQWKILENSCNDVDLIADCALNSVQTGGKETLVPLMDFMRDFIRIRTDNTKFMNLITDEFIPNCFESVFYYRKNEIFWPALNSFLDLTFQPKLVEKYPQILEKLADKIFSESANVAGLAPCLLSHLVKNKISGFSSVIAEALCHGSVYRKDRKIVSDINELIANTDSPINYIEGSDHNLESSVRISGLNLLLLYDEDNYGILIRKLEEIDERETGNKKRYFENSHIHLLRHRIFTNYLIMSTISKNSRVIYDIALNSILRENQQLSVRYLSEWILIIILIKNPGKYYDELMSHYELAKKTRLGCIPSFIVVFTQYILVNPKLDLLDKLLSLIAPWCMAQHFGTRIVAQVNFRKIYKLIAEKEMKELKNKWSVIYNCLEETIGQGNQAKNVEKLSHDFYLSTFDALEDLNLMTLLCDFPRLCHITDITPYESIELINCGNRINQKSTVSLMSNHADNTDYCFCSRCSPNKSLSITGLYPGTSRSFMSSLF